MDLSEKIFGMLDQAYKKGFLKPGIQQDAFPILAGRLEKLVNQPACKSAMDDVRLLATMSNHLDEDGPRIQGLIEGNKELWDDLTNGLLKSAARVCSDLPEEDRQDVVQEALLRLAKYLPGFCFRSSFAWYAQTILKNEYMRWNEKEGRNLKDDKKQPVISLDQSAAEEDDGDAPDLHDIQKDNRQPGVAAQVEFRALIERTKKLLDGLELKILACHLAGYTLEEMRQDFAIPLSVSQISRILKRALKKMRDDNAFPDEFAL